MIKYFSYILINPSYNCFNINSWDKNKANISSYIFLLIAFFRDIGIMKTRYC